MEFFYDKHDKNYDEFVNNSEKSRKAKAWLDLDSLDYWRHNRMLNLLKPIINTNDKWLTIGDGRYGSEASWLKRKGVNCHSSDMHTNLIELAFDKGFIDSFSKQNAEELNFESNSFDYVLIKETLHHLPRPWLAIYEAFRVCKKAVIIIEPQDTYPYQNPLGILCIKLKNLAKKFLRRRVYQDEYSFEEVGNFIYTINTRELEKFLLGMHKTSIATNKINDHYLKNIEFVSIRSNNLKEKILFIKLKSIILIKDFLCNLGFLKFAIGEVILFKNNPSINKINYLKKYNWNFKKLPQNPYI